MIQSPEMTFKRMRSIYRKTIKGSQPHGTPKYHGELENMKYFDQYLRTKKMTSNLEALNRCMVRSEIFILLVIDGKIFAIFFGATKML